MEIPSEIEERIKQFSKMYGISEEILTQEMLEYLPEIREKHPRMSHEKRLLLCLRLLKLQLQREEGSANSKAIMHTGFFFGCSPIENTADRMIAKIKRMPADLQEKFHPEPEVWLDYREESKNYMKPIQGIDHRTYYFIGSTGRELDESRVMPGVLEVWGDLVTKVVPQRLHVLYNFRALPKDSNVQLPYYDLKASTVTRFRPASQELSYLDQERLARKLFDIFDVDEVETIYEIKFVPPEDPEERQLWKREPIFIEGDVQRIFYTDETKQNVIHLSSGSLSSNAVLTCFVPKYLTINFSENSRILAYGILSKITDRRNNKEEIVMNMRGYINVPLESEFVKL